ncbi:hypothetical protein ABCR94_34170 [Streptomyces sp. 21So2-11]|uniref:hypothetical protein n=1 Tax=Streptomyces sp. 21So2-11 TaxID=3144408 RepID=UPI00321BC511
MATGETWLGVEFAGDGSSPGLAGQRRTDCPRVPEIRRVAGPGLLEHHLGLSGRLRKSFGG